MSPSKLYTNFASDLIRCFAIFCVVFVIGKGPKATDARAVNISNTWVLPQEGFPVFYRYFRDRISWYEADAVCQFHHANLVTVDTTAQYDAARAYLKELDIMSDVWIGLIKSNEEGVFSWTDYKPLSGEGYWAATPSGGRAPLCAALDPTRDYRWSALSCGGPQVASFICELPVPAWAVRESGGCLVRSLPSLTVQFLPELAAVQLVSDCGLDGTKKVTCKSNEDHKDILKELSCIIPDEDFSDNTVSGPPDGVSTSAVATSSGSTHSAAASAPWGWPTTTPPAGDFTSTRLRRETLEPSSTTPVSISPTTATRGSSLPATQTTPTAAPVKPETPTSTTASPSRKPTSPNKLPEGASVSESPAKVLATTPEQPKTTEKVILQAPVEIHHPIKKIQEHIYTQESDHFIPPLVMAKSKLGSDMTVVSSQSKHLQHKAAVQHDLKVVVESTPRPTVVPEPVIVTSVKISPEGVPPQVAITPKVVRINVPKETIVVKINEPLSMALDTTMTYTSTTDKPTTESKFVTQLTTTLVPTTEGSAKMNETPMKNESKLRKPGKGKKYDKAKEEKKKTPKETTTEASRMTTETIHKVVEISIPSTSGSKAPMTVFEITTILSNPSTEKHDMPTKANTKQATSTQPTVDNVTTPKVKETKIMIDPNIMKLNKDLKINNQSEQINQTKINTESKTVEVKKADTREELESDVKTVPIQYLIEANGEKIGSDVEDSESPEHNAEPLPRPNRSRLLSQSPQHRSFYPYFFNRVLG